MNGKLLFVPGGGLGNRMRAVASAYELKRQTGVSIDVVWITDWTFGAPWSGIFQPLEENGFKVRDASLFDRILYDKPRRHNLWLPLLPQKLMFEQRIDDYEVTPLKRRGFDFAAWAGGRRSYMGCYQEFGPIDSSIYPKLYRPLEVVERLTETFTDQFAPHTVGFHIRRTDHNEATERSPLSLFISKAEEILSGNPSAKIFLATDDESVKQQLSRLFGNPIITTPAGTYSRETTEGMREALAEMLALSRTEKIYGCFGSTFPVVASRMSGTPLEVLEQDDFDRA